MTVVLHFDARDGWSLRSQHGGVLCGPTWSMTVVNAWADENNATIVREDTTHAD